MYRTHAMYTPTPQDFDVLVALSRDARLDPIDAAIVLFHESGFDPSLDRRPVADVFGLNSMSAANLATLRMTPAAWTSLSASDQLPHVFAFWRGLGQEFNAGRMPRDAGELLALNFLPGAFKNIAAADHPDAPLAGVDGPFAWAYADNPPLQNATGTITVNTLRTYLAHLKARLSTSAHWSLLVSGIRNALARAGGLGPPSTGETAASPAGSPLPAAGAKVTAAGLPLVGWLAVGVLAVAGLALRPGRV